MVRKPLPADIQQKLETLYCEKQLKLRKKKALQIDAQILHEDLKQYRVESVAKELGLTVTEVYALWHQCRKEGRGNVCTEIQ